MRRTRRSAASARRLILDAAEKQLAERGAEGVRVQDVAEQIGIAPATVLHHFGSRDGLLGELMVHGAEQLRSRLEALVADARPDLSRLSAELVELYASRGSAALYASLTRAQRPPPDGAPIFERLLERLCDGRGLASRRQQERAADAVLVLNLVAFAEALVGSPMRAAVGIADDAPRRARLQRWLGRLLDDSVSAA
jgi:AcrR family transcriptional regulator